MESSTSSVMVIIYSSLKEGGQTALGPALLVSVLIASRIPGSKVNYSAYFYSIPILLLHIRFIGGDLH